MSQSEDTIPSTKEHDTAGEQSIEDPEDVVERHRDTIEDAIAEFGPDHPGAKRLQNLLDEFGGDA